MGDGEGLIVFQKKNNQHYITDVDDGWVVNSSFRNNLSRYETTRWIVSILMFHNETARGQKRNI